LGADTYLFVEVGAEQPLVVRQAGGVHIPVGAKIMLKYQEGHLHRFDENGKPMR